MEVTRDIEGLLAQMAKRRSVRRFKPDPIPDAWIRKMVEGARWASSGANSQPWEFVVVRDPEVKRAIANIFVESIPQKREIYVNFPVGSKVFLWKKYAEAPVLIVVCLDPRLAEAYPRDTRRQYRLDASLGAAMEHIHLCAAAMGLGSSWGTVEDWVDDRIRELLDIPSPLIIREVISVGYPDDEPRPRRRRDVESLIHWERFDRAKLRTEEEIASLIATRRAPDMYSGARPAESA